LFAIDGMMGSLLDRLQGFFSKSFILAGFLPLAAALILNGLLLQWVFPQTRPLLHTLLQPDSGSVLPNWMLLILLTYVLGMVLASLTPGLRHLLEGSYLPHAIQDWKRRWFYSELKRKQEERHKISKELFQLLKARKKEGGWGETLRNARLQGDKLPLTRTQLNPALRAMYAGLKAKQLHWEPVSFEELQAMFTPLQVELQTHPARQIEELDQMHVGFVELLDYACGKIEIEYSPIDAAIRLRYPREVGGLKSTELANLAEVQREYGVDRFGLDSELLWLRMLKLARADKEFYPLLDDAKTQLDFAVVVTVLLGVTVLIWLPLSLLFSSTVWPYLLVSVICLPAVPIFYRIVLQAYITYAEIVRAAVDLYRFDMLKALHIPLPKDLTAEKETWNQLASLAATGGAKLTYKHGDAETPQKPAATSGTFWQRLKTLLGVK
jgi:hypothetical protein